MSTSIKEGRDYQVKINYSNRFGFIAIYESNREFGHEFPFNASIAKELELSTNPDDIDSIVNTNYKGKKGSKCL